MQGRQPPDQAAQSHIQPGLACLQGWGIHSLLGQGYVICGLLKDISIHDSYLTQLTGSRGRCCRVWLVWRLVVVSEEEEQACVPIADMAAAETPLYRPQYELSMAFLILERLQPSQPTDYISAAHPA